MIYKFLTITLILIFVFYFPSAFYSIKAFDELTIFKESYLPVCLSIREIFELVSHLGLKYFFESANTLYSSITSLRCNPLGNFLQLFVQFLFQKNPVYYHLYGIFLHLINTALVFFILNKGAFHGTPPQENKSRLSIVSIFTLLWALHPVNIESVLLITNANILLSHTFALLTFLIYIVLLQSNVIARSNFVATKQSPNVMRLPRRLFQSLLAMTPLPALFTAEFHFMLPFILISYTIALEIHKGPFITCFTKSIKTALPLLISASLFLIFFLLSNTRVNINPPFSIRVLFERVFWLSPQILFHFIKVLVLPIKLSIDQSLLVNLGGSLFDPYSIFCIFFIAFILIFSFYSLFKAKAFPITFIICIPFLLSLIPFSQILAPVYNLASERYLYFPSFVLIFGISHFVFSIISKYETQKNITNSMISLLVIGLVIYSGRAYIRMWDWKDSFSLYNSAIKATGNPLYKALRYKGLVPQEMLLYELSEKSVSPEYKKLAIKNLTTAMKELKEKKKKYQSTVPQVIKYYGLDPLTLLTKAGYLLAQVDYGLNNDPKRSLKIISPYTKNLSLLGNDGLSFYASLLYHNNMLDKAEEVLKYAYKRDPYSLQIFYSLCDLIQIKYGDIDEIERYTVKSFKYYPYDTAVLFLLTKIYQIKGDAKKFAYYSYLYGIRHHSRELINTNGY